MDDSVFTATASKIVDLGEIGQQLDGLRHGSTVVLCHGAFDLLHIGHVKHFRAAKAHGDVLVVTVTADEFINKGPGRPVFAAELRAEMLAALDCVDFVAIVPAPSAIPAIDAVRPDIYVKGGEYEQSEQDITGKIKIEREAVERHGGQVVFTHEATYSSSSLLNRHFGATSAAARSYLDAKGGQDLLDHVGDCLDRIANMRVVVVGETIVDRYVYVDAMGKAAKENIIATLRRSEEAFAGGAIAAANHIASLCANVELVTLVGDAESGPSYEGLVEDALADNVRATFIRRPGGPTVRKTRFVEPTYVRKLFEVYDMNDEPLPESVQRDFEATLEAKVADADMVVVCDFGHGLIQSSTVGRLEDKAPFLAVNAQSNAGNIGFNLITKYRSPDFICVDALEARLASGSKHASQEKLAGLLRETLPGRPNVIVTSGKAGCYVAGNGVDQDIHVPSFGDEAVDTVGAGDAFFVVAAPFLAVGATCETAGLMGNVAGAIKIGIVGHRRSITKLEIQRFLTTLLK